MTFTATRFRSRSRNRMPNWVSQIVTLAMLTFSVGCSAEPETKAVESGVHYTKIDSSVDKVGPKESVSVVEFFSYACPHCAHLEPGVKKWTSDLPSYIKFDHMPAFWNEPFERLAKAYYTASILKKEPELRQKIFNAIHKQGKSLQTDAAIKAFFEQHGVDGKDFDKLYNSFAVKQKMKLANDAFRKYKLRSVPVFVVADQYVTSLGTAGSEEQLWKTLNHLTAKVKSGEL